MIMHATIQQMRLFEAVARHGSVTRAAEEVHLTQPAVSIQIRRLEENAGISLFDQIGRKLYLTAAGLEVLESSRKILGEMDHLSDTVDTMRGEVSGPLRVSVVTTAQYFLPHLLGEFVRLYPKVKPYMAVTNRDSMLARLESYQDDVYIMGHVPGSIEVTRFPFVDDNITVVAHPDHPFVGRAGVTLKDLVAERVLVREQGSGTRRATERLLEEHGLTMTPYMELGSAVALKQGVMAGLGIAVLSRYSISQELQLGKLAVIECEAFPLVRPWYAVHQSDRLPSITVRTFLAFLEKEGARLIGAMAEI